MKSQQELNYNRIADAIRFIKKNYRTQPKLEEIAEHINMSPFHFQRMFSEWAGTTPKRFLQYLNIEYAKKILKETHATLFDTACELGLSTAIAEARKEKYLTKEEVKKMCGVCDTTLWHWSKKNYLKPVKVGNKVRYRQSDIQRILGEHNPLI